MKLVLPGILLASLFVFFVFRADARDRFPAALSLLKRRRPSASSPQRSSSALPRLPPSRSMALVSSAAAAVLYARFRLPFALLLIAGCLVIAAEAMASRLWSASELLLSLVTLFCGIAVFTAAMSLRPLRPRARHAPGGLRVLAASACRAAAGELADLVQSSPSNPRFAMTTMTAIAVLLMIAVLTIVAIVIDRRALLVSALTYLGSVIAYCDQLGRRCRPHDGAVRHDDHSRCSGARARRSAGCRCAGICCHCSRRPSSSGSRPVVPV